MMNKKLKFFLYIRVSDLKKIKFQVSNAVLYKSLDNLQIFVGEHDSLKNTLVTVELLSIADSESYIQIEKIEICGITIKSFKNWTRYIVNGSSDPIETHGWMACPGKYFLKFRQSPLIHSYLTNFLSICNIK
jgi:hypothetical protein